MDRDDRADSTGMITSRKCPHCGHHEIGYTTREGEFHTLRPGTFIQVLERAGAEGPSSERDRPPEQTPIEAETESEIYRAWAPEPVKGNRRLRLKYGVFIRADMAGEEITPRVYVRAFVKKLQQLIAREMNTPLPVILDRYFTAPHLASGNPRQISEAIWEALEEIRKPAKLVEDWLKKRDQESLKGLIYPETKEGLAQVPIDDEAFKGELEGLELEAFLDLL